MIHEQASEEERGQGGDTGPSTQAACVLLCSAYKKFFYLLSFLCCWRGRSNSPELNRPSSDVPRAAIARDFPRGHARKLKLGLVLSHGSWSGPRLCLLLLDQACSDNPRMWAQSLERRGQNVYGRELLLHRHAGVRADHRALKLLLRSGQAEMEPRRPLWLFCISAVTHYNPGANRIPTVTQAPPLQKNPDAREGDTILTDTIVQDTSLQPGSQITRDIVLIFMICMSRNKLGGFGSCVTSRSINPAPLVLPRLPTSSP